MSRRHHSIKLAPLGGATGVRSTTTTASSLITAAQDSLIPLQNSILKTWYQFSQWHHSRGVCLASSHVIKCWVITACKVSQTMYVS